MNRLFTLVTSCAVFLLLGSAYCFVGGLAWALIVLLFGHLACELIDKK